MALRLPVVLFALFAQSQSIQVTVEQGILEGEQLESVAGDGSYYSFKGIPYAAPPVDSLRFTAPQSPASWEGVRNATAHGSICIQNNIFTYSISGEEDCLYLNVYTPNVTPDTLLPVMFYIHGGGYTQGSGDFTYFGPDFLATRDVVVVTINYRLHAFGFLSLDTEDVPGNAGLKDQAAALKWVVANIEQFGGNPSNITLFGQSAGGASVALHMISPMTRNLFQRAIIMSSTPYCDWILPYQAQRRAFQVGKLLGNDTQSVDELYEFLQNVDAESLVATRSHVLITEDQIHDALKMYDHVPVIEKDFGQERFLVENITTALQNGNVSQIDIIIGYTNEETILGIPTVINDTVIAKYKFYPEMVVPRKLLMKLDDDKALEISDMITEHYFPSRNFSMRNFITFASESAFLVDTQRFVPLFNKYVGTNVFQYRFSMYSDRNVYAEGGLTYNITGAAHQDDTAYLFDPKYYNLTITTDSTEYQLVDTFCTLVTNFAKYGNPTPDSSLNVTWPTYDSSTESYLEIGNTLSVATSLNADMMTFWKSVYEAAGVKEYYFVED